jgi:5'-nucleotidase / UDP-sugar diphosphatase
MTENRFRKEDCRQVARIGKKDHGLKANGKFLIGTSYSQYAPQNSKATYLRAISLAALFSGLILFLADGPAFMAGARAAEDPFILTIIHTNDLHSHHEPYKANGKQVGGIARMAGLIRKLRKESPSALTVDAGDYFQGSAFYSQFKGEVEIEVLNRIGYDIATLGNHEFDDGAENLAKQLKNAKFEVISSNLDFSDEPELAAIVKPATIKEIDGEKIGFIGVTTPDLSGLTTSLGGVKLKAINDRWHEPVAAEVEKLTGEGIDKIVVISHCGFLKEKELAGRIPQIDAIIGGHSHTRLSRPVIVAHENGSSTTIVQTGCYARALGKLALAFDNRGHVDTARTNYQLIDIEHELPEDRDIKRYIAKMDKKLSPDRHIVIGKAVEDFGAKSKTGNSAIGSLICDAIRDSAKDLDTKASQTGLIAFQNRGGIRGELQAGPITLSDLQQILPFSNRIVYATISGELLMRTLEHSLGNGHGGRFLEVSGLRFAYDSRQARGKKIIFAQALGADGEWHDIDIDSEYRIAMNDFNFEGGEGYDFNGARDVVKSEMTIAQALQKYLKIHTRVSPGKSDRIISLRSNVIELLDKKDKSFLEAKQLPPGSRIRLVVGKKTGISIIFDGLPVPLCEGKPLDTRLNADKEGNFQWCIDQSRKAAIKERIAGSTAQNLALEEAWLCAIIHEADRITPDNKKKRGRTYITAPLRISL